jgi:hypothetical protein
MALVVEDGTGLANADAYVSVADCDEYHDLRINTDWTGIPASPDPTATKEAYIRKATEYLDARYNDYWQGAQMVVGQALAWPRGYVYNDGVELADDALPRNLVRATCEVALLLAQGTDIAPVLERGGKIRALTQVVGPLSERTAWADDAPTTSTFTAVDRLIKPLLDTGFGINGMVYRG